MARAVPATLFGGAGGVTEVLLPDLAGSGIDRPPATTLLWTDSGWSDGGAPAALLPDSWFIVRNNTSSPAVWIPIGDVSQATEEREVGRLQDGPQDTPISLPRPGLLSPVAAGFLSGDVLQENSKPGLPGDALMGFRTRSGPIGRVPDRTLYRLDGRLVEPGAESVDLSNEAILDGATGWIIRRSGAPAELLNHATHATP
jgi:hypothetical protein